MKIGGSANTTRLIATVVTTLGLATLAAGCVHYHSAAYAEDTQRLYIVRESGFIFYKSTPLACSVADVNLDQPAKYSEAMCTEVAFAVAPPTGLPSGAAVVPVTSSEPEPTATEPEPEPAASAPPPPPPAKPAAPPPPPPRAEPKNNCGPTENEIAIPCANGTSTIKLCTSRDGSSCRFMAAGQAFPCERGCNCEAARVKAEAVCR